MADDTRKTERFVVLPQGKLISGKIALRFAPESSPTEVAALEYNRKRHQLLRVGHVYEFDSANDRTTFWVSSSKWVGEYSDKAKVLEWQAEQKAADLAAALAATQKREATNTSGLDEAIEPLRKAYQSLIPPQRLAFELYVLSVMRRR